MPSTGVYWVLREQNWPGALGDQLVAFRCTEYMGITWRALHDKQRGCTNWIVNVYPICDLYSARSILNLRSAGEFLLSRCSLLSIQTTMLWSQGGANGCNSAWSIVVQPQNCQSHCQIPWQNRAPRAWEQGYQASCRGDTDQANEKGENCMFTGREDGVDILVYR